MSGTNAHGDPTATVSTTAVLLANSTESLVALVANTDRRWAIFTNDSSNTIYLAIATSTGAATANSGVRLNADGGSFEMSPVNGNLDIRTVHAIAAASTGNNLLICTAS